MDSQAVICAKDADHCIATWNQTLVIVWRYATTADAVMEVNRIARGLLASAGGPVTSLSIIEPTSEIPSGKARAELAVFSRDVVLRMALAVIAAEGGGFRSATVRSIGTALTAILPHRVPFKFVETVSQGASALAPHLPEGSGGADALVRAVAALRAEIARGP